MLCLALGGDPLFNNPINKFYSIYSPTDQPKTPYQADDLG